MAMWMDQVVRGWLLYDLTNSPIQLGLVHGVQAIPILVLSPVAGEVRTATPASGKWWWPRCWPG